MISNILLFMVKNPCEDITVLRIVYILKQILSVVFILVPIILIVLILIDLAKNVIAGKEEDIAKNKKLAIKRVIYAVVIFFVPTVVSVFMSIIGDLGADYSSCMNVTKESLSFKIENNKNGCTASDMEWNEVLSECVKKRRYTKIDDKDIVSSGHGGLSAKQDEERDVTNSNYEPDDNTGVGDYTGKLGLPLAGDSIAISSMYGRRTKPCSGCSSFHRGLDFGVGVGNKVYAVDGGEVVIAQMNKYRGNYIVVKHDENLYTFYQHLSKMLVKVGDKVDKGMIIALSGNTGVGTGAHLHFEMATSKSGGATSFDPCGYKDYTCSNRQFKLK